MQSKQLTRLTSRKESDLFGLNQKSRHGQLRDDLAIVIATCMIGIIWYFTN